MGNKFFGMLGTIGEFGAVICMFSIVRTFSIWKKIRIFCYCIFLLFTTHFFISCTNYIPYPIQFISKLMLIIFARNHLINVNIRLLLWMRVLYLNYRQNVCAISDDLGNEDRFLQHSQMLGILCAVLPLNLSKNLLRNENSLWGSCSRKYITQTKAVYWQTFQVIWEQFQNS